MIRSITRWGRNAYSGSFGSCDLAGSSGWFSAGADGARNPGARRKPALVLSRCPVCRQPRLRFRPRRSGRADDLGAACQRAAQGALRLSALADRRREARTLFPGLGRAGLGSGRGAEAGTGGKTKAGGGRAPAEAGRRLHRCPPRRQPARHVALPRARPDRRACAAGHGGHGDPLRLAAGLVEGGAAVPPAAVAAQPRQTAAAQTATVAPMAQQPVRQGRSTPLRITLAEPADPIDLVQPVVPKGYKLAWSDGRLNAKRAQGTARGQAQQDLVWTQETPARLVTRAERAKIRAAQQQQAVTMSTKGTAAAPRYVQVGSFGDPANAAAASARLAGWACRSPRGGPRRTASPCRSFSQARLWMRRPRVKPCAWPAATALGTPS